jgi:hypothetical protein
MAPFAQKRIPAHLLPAVTPNGRGRPSEYDPAYCDMVIEAMGRGLSLTAFAGMIRKSRECVYGWIAAHSDFADAVSRAKAARTLWWEQKLMRSRKGAETTATIFALRNAQPDEWRDVRSVEHSHLHAIGQLTDAQLHAIAAGKLADVGDGMTIDGDPATP